MLAFNNRSFLDRIEPTLLTYGWLQSATEFEQFCRHEPWKFANWPVKFSKIGRGKLVALQMTCHKWWHIGGFYWYVTSDLCTKKLQSLSVI